MDWYNREVDTQIANIFFFNTVNRPALGNGLTKSGLTISIKLLKLYVKYMLFTITATSKIRSVHEKILSN